MTGAGHGVTTLTMCGSCGTELRDSARFCDGCGAPVRLVHNPAEYKHVTVLFADVVGSMDIAATLGAERLREIMTELFYRSAVVVQRCGGIVEASSSCLKIIVAQLMLVSSVVNILAYSVFHAAAVAMTSSQTAKLAVISVRHWGALIR